MPDNTTEAAKASESGTNDTSTDELGDGGKRALEAERKARREAERQLREVQDKLRDFESADLRRDVATAKNLTPAQARRLAGSTREELEADADDLLAAFGPSKEAVGSSLRTRPQERTSSGSVPGAGGNESPAKIAEKILNRGI